MAIYRAGEIRKMSPKERGEKLDELRAELLREHGVKAAGGAPKNPGRIRALRKTIARLLTIGVVEAPKAPPAAPKPPAGPAKAPAKKRAAKPPPASRKAKAPGAKAPRRKT